MRTGAGLLLAAAAFFAAHALAQSPEQSYRAKCSLCHDGGAGQAPRIADRAAWVQRAARGRSVLYDIALNGKPDTAMAPKGGFAELSDAQTRAIVDYMLTITGNAAAPLLAAVAPESAPRGTATVPDSGAVPGTDEAVSVTIAERLRMALGKPDNRIETYDGVVTLRGVGIKVETRQGIATLGGTVHDSEFIKRAGEIAAASPGVTRVVNRLIAAALFEWD